MSMDKDKEREIITAAINAVTDIAAHSKHIDAGTYSSILIETLVDIILANEDTEKGLALMNELLEAEYLFRFDSRSSMVDIEIEAIRVVNKAIATVSHGR